MNDIGRLSAFLTSVKRVRLLVVGDLMQDRYVLGEVTRISPEAPIQILRVREELARLGGAANVMRNVRGLGGEVVPCGVVGKDAPGDEVRRGLKGIAADLRGVIVDPSRPTTVKTRLVAQSQTAQPQQVLRVDWEDARELSAAAHRKLARFLESAVRRVDGVLISDYGKGLLTPELLRRLIAAARRRGKWVLVDPKGTDYSRYRGATAITPNRHEAQEATGMTLSGMPQVERAARRLKRKLGLEAAFVTLGKDGIGLLDPENRFIHLRAQARSVYDVTGAGDTVVAALGMALGRGATWEEAAALANAAASVVVGKLGAEVATPPEILAALGQLEHHPKVFASPAALAAELRSRRKEGKKIVFTNGCFDLVHPGHIQVLESSRSLGDLLVVAINTDRSIRRYKGKGRPIVGEKDRATVLASLSCVDYVTFFDTPTPEKVIRKLRPDVLVKGEDWKDKGVVGQAFVERYGGRVELVQLKPGYSTTRLIQKAAALENGRPVPL